MRLVGGVKVRGASRGRISSLGKRVVDGVGVGTVVASLEGGGSGGSMIMLVDCIKLELRDPEMYTIWSRGEVREGRFVSGTAGGVRVLNPAVVIGRCPLRGSSTNGHSSVALLGVF